MFSIFLFRLFVSFLELNRGSDFGGKARDEAGKGESRASCALQRHRWDKLAMTLYWCMCSEHDIFSVWVLIKIIMDFEFLRDSFGHKNPSKKRTIYFWHQGERNLGRISLFLGCPKQIQKDKRQSGHRGTLHWFRNECVLSPTIINASNNTGKCWCKM